MFSEHPPFSAEEIQQIRARLDANRIAREEAERHDLSSGLPGGQEAVAGR
jgi:hypothetical protein